MRKIAILAIVAIALLATPFPTVIVPEMSIFTKDSSGHPVEGVEILMSWAYYGNDKAHTEKFTTDKTGTIHLYPRRYWGSASIRLFNLSVSAMNIHSPIEKYIFLSSPKNVFEPMVLEGGNFAESYGDIQIIIK